MGSLVTGKLILVLKFSLKFRLTFIFCCLNATRHDCRRSCVTGGPNGVDRCVIFAEIELMKVSCLLHENILETSGSERDFGVSSARRVHGMHPGCLY